MNAKEAIEILDEEPSTKEIIIAYWTRNRVEYNLDTQLTDKEWEELVEYTTYKMDWSSISDMFDERIREIRSRNE